MPGHRKRRQFKQTDAFTRGMVIGLKRAGWSIRQIAADTHLGASTVHRLWRRWLEQGNVAIYRNVGATRVTSARVDRRILRQAVAAPQATCTAILQHVQDTLDQSISNRTISRRLVANGLHSCRPLRRLPLTPPNRRQRLEWCRARSTWMTKWHRVVFSDESRFCLSSDSRRLRVWRRCGERSNPAAIVERPTVRQSGIMVWGAIAYDSRSPLLRIQGTMTAQRYVDDVLRPVTLPYLQEVPNALYQQDNARPHTARISQQALEDHVWDIIGRRLHALPQPRLEDVLWQMVEREWRAIPQDAIRTLIDSLPRRVAACIAVRVLCSPMLRLPTTQASLLIAAAVINSSCSSRSRGIVIGDSLNAHFLAADVDGDNVNVARPQDALPQDGNYRREEAGETRSPEDWDTLKEIVELLPGVGGDPERSQHQNFLLFHLFQCYRGLWVLQKNVYLALEMEDDHRPTVNGSYLPCQRQRDPSTFSGDGNINPGQWLKEYERVSKYNRWDETMKLANVVFHLNGTAGRRIRGVFGLQEDSARRAEEVLKSRAQKAEESSESYIQEILSLCHQVNPRMEEGEIVTHIIKGISEDTYQVLVAKDIQTVDEILKFCRHLTTVKQRRIGRTKFARLSNVMPISCVDDSDDLAGLIRRIVREEIQKVFSAPEVINPLREVNALEQTVREEVSRALQPTRPQVNVPRKVASPKTIPVANPSFQPFSQASECEKLSGAASNGGEVAIEENPPGYIAAKLKENFVMVEINGRKIKALVDSGADFSVISDKFRRELKTPLFKEPGPILKAANKKLIETLGKCVLNIEVNGLKISFEFVVMVECSHYIIFGWDFFKATVAVIDCGRNELHLGETSVLESREEENLRLFASDDFVIPPKSIKKISVINDEVCGDRDVLVSTSKDLLLKKEVLIPNSLVTFRHGRGSIWVANGASWPRLIPSGMNMCTMESYENGNICSLIESSDKLQETQLKSREWSQKINLTLDPGLSEIQRLQLVSCLDEFIDIFDFGSTSIKPTSTVKHKINTGDHSSIKQRPYRVAPSERRLIQDEVNKMIENHILKPSESPWSSPVILVRKKDGTWGFCVDYRRLNE
ncbi:hypothetical protein LAZ67_X003137 [Cordylochernes scorpioides]|uniref:Peptidase A2 domain-containing protein n=1 Tax=Cordylochernes scorpioides TaxID=51811 RepID=A0ABY6LTX4_9ARAC|nr:hypothetical protein LAZ67_X003137 [Cordylochernes scorpioides]